MWHLSVQRERSVPQFGAQTKSTIWIKEQAQSLVEVALFLPLLLLLILYAVDYGYFFMTAASISGSARTAVEYSVQGFSSPSQGAYPAAGPIGTAGTVAATAMSDLSFKDSSTVTKVQVCSPSAGTTGNVVCKQYNGATAYTLDADPEPTQFKMNRVDVVYTITPPIPLALPFFSQTILSTSKMTFHRMIEMRAY